MVTGDFDGDTKIDFVIGTLIERLADEFGIQAHNAGLTLRVVGSTATVHSDPALLERVLRNLLSNAIKFTPPGGTITVNAIEADDGWVNIAVTDTGIGIPADQIERVQRPFEQSDNRYNRAAGGTGLGLALVKGLAELHGGSLRIDSTPGTGTTVSIRLPHRRPRVVTAA